MSWLINNSTKCKYWSYNYDKELLNLINNHYKKFSSKSLKLKNNDPCKNNYTLEYDFSHFSDEEYINIHNPNKLKKLGKKIKKHFGNEHFVYVISSVINNKSNTRFFNKIKKKSKKTAIKISRNKIYKLGDDVYHAYEIADNLYGISEATYNAYQDFIKCSLDSACLSDVAEACIEDGACDLDEAEALAGVTDVVVA